ncbi:MAG TPA: penicillin-binding transpeptidase domain-containing protein [Bacillota bacterium]|nr:penicillin-binding transpeptidase domain-containing protein [Bacillota bacterium]
MSQLDTISKKRTAVLLLMVLVITGLLVLRVIYLQFFLADWLKKSAENQRFRALPVLPSRGTIYDRLGNELAISIDGDSVYAIPAEIGFIPEPKSQTQTILNQTPARLRNIEADLRVRREKKEIAEIVGKILAMDPSEVERLISQRASFVWLKRKASFEEIDQLRKALLKKNILGIEITQKARRFYPQSYLAAQILGIAGVDNQGLEGIEKQYDSYLRGIPGSDQAEFDTAGRHIPLGERRYLAPVNGDSIYLTIDENIQYIAERELDRAVSETGSKRGMALTINPKTGEILALAIRPKYDPNKFSEYPAANRRNPLFSDMYEPGSTFKIFTSIAALEEGKVSLNSTFFDPGYIKVSGKYIHCHKPGGHGSQTFIQALENSCNPVFASLALDLKKDVFYKYITAFGFGKITGVDFPGESPGWLRPLSGVKDLELSNIGFGQGVTVTPIQMAMGVAAVANGGYLLKPQLVKKIVSPEGKIILENHRQVVNEVLSRKTASVMCELLQSVVTNGSGNLAYLEGYRVAGKTGTSEKVTQGMKGYQDKRIASFIGFAPADDARVLTLVILDEPSCPIKYGAVIAAPVVGNIFRDTLRYLNIRPKYQPEVLEKIASTEIMVPNILYMSTSDAIKILKQKQLNYRLIGQGSYVFDQIPKPGAKINRDTKILIYFDPEEQYNRRGNEIVLPDFHGYSLRKVDELMTRLGLKLDSKGTGVAAGQTPPPGSVVAPGSTVYISFQPGEEQSP